MIKRQGFTLIEILIVVAIIAILASVVLIGLGPTQQSGRDARRLSDLHEIQNGLELYFNKCGYYPGTAPNAVCTNGATTGYVQMSAALVASGLVTQVPNDPTTGKNYFFRSTGASATGYLLAATLENANNSVFTNYTAPPVAAYTSGDNIAACATSGNANKTSVYCLTL